MARERIHASIAPSTKRRLEKYCEERDGVSQGDVIDTALKNFFEMQDHEYVAPDFVLDRINQILNAIMQHNQMMYAMNERLKTIEERFED